MDFIGIIFINIKDNKLLGFAFCNLTAKLTTNRTATTRDENRLTRIILQTLFFGNINGFAEQEVFDLEFTNRGLRKTVAVGVANRQVINLDLTTAQAIKIVETGCFLARNIAERNEHLADSVALYLFKNACVLIINGKTVNARADLCFIFIDKENRFIDRTAVVGQITRK